MTINEDDHESIAGAGTSLVEFGAREDLPVPDIDRELRVAVVDRLRGDAPRTVLGVLLALAPNETMSISAVAGALDKDLFEVEETLELLREEQLCLTLVEGGVRKVMAAAAYVQENDPEEVGTTFLPFAT